MKINDVVLNTPFIAEPAKAETAIREIVGTQLALVDAFDFREIMHGPEHVSSFVKVTVGIVQLEGMDYWLLDSAGLIKEMTVLRPRADLCRAVSNRPGSTPRAIPGQEHSGDCVMSITRR
jgi:hypothetical protein